MIPFVPSEHSMEPLLTLGEGPETVYVYFDPMDQHVAQALGWGCWRCKIGSTIGSGERRIFHQTSHKTAFSYFPVWGLCIKTVNSSWVERRIHQILDAQKVEGSRGCEWFWTSPQEVAALFKAFPVAPLPVRTLSKEIDEPLSQGDMQEILNAAEASVGEAVTSHSQWSRIRTFHLIRLAYYSTCRISSLLKLKWDDLVRHEDGYELRGFKAERIPLDVGEALLKSRNIIQKSGSAKDTPSTYIFRITGRTAQRTLKEVDPRLSPRVLRMTARKWAAIRSSGVFPEPIWT